MKKSIVQRVVVVAVVSVLVGVSVKELATAQPLQGQGQGQSNLLARVVVLETDVAALQTGQAALLSRTRPRNAGCEPGASCLPGITGPKKPGRSRVHPLFQIVAERALDDTPLGQNDSRTSSPCLADVIQSKKSVMPYRQDPAPAVSFFGSGVFFGSQRGESVK